jgi:asparagine synthase (glutamine-hydrolysing)
MVKLRELLLEAVEEACESKTGVVFSAGVDSTLIASLASEFSEVTAYSCGVRGSPDLEYAGKCQNLGFDIKLVELDVDEVEHSLGEIVSLINDRNPVKVSVEIPFYFISKKARADGLDVMLCGQGADELFGGYARYLDALPDYGRVDEMLRKDVANIYEEQLNKDVAVFKANGIELRIPYMDNAFKDYAMKIPGELKIRESEEFSCFDEVDGRRFIRKYILRRLAGDRGVPAFILNRKKKATQYGSGAWKMLDRIARKRGFKEKASKTGRTDYVRMFLEGFS